ncbi:hypothetical protein SAMN03159488_03420 [Pseudomonas sp. NFIX10]|nr:MULTISPECIES: hypothetical protein [unclassified Pseudomonas]SFB38373.1 hypothetical protein SAMN03159488_03420 [Pseudomonas sp. NFIX10]SFF47105.1 hypothetical protein SAMN03159367_04732 [Pseudomonas sp. NFACC06-1]
MKHSGSTTGRNRMQQQLFTKATDFATVDNGKGGGFICSDCPVLNKVYTF